MKRIPELDGLRGVAILCVLLWHCVGARMDVDQDWSRLVLNCLNLAWTGVDLFFVLSGFLIGGMLLDHRDADNFLRVFYARRALRILPPYCLLLISYAAAKHGLLPVQVPGAEDLFLPGPPMWIYGVFFQNVAFALTGSTGTAWLGPTWSLAVEEQFYLCLPLVMFLIPRTQLWPILVGLIAAAPLFRILLYDFPPMPGLAAYVLMPGRADALLLGVLGAWLVRQASARDWLRTHGLWLRISLLVLLAGVVVFHRFILGFTSFALMALGYTWLALFYLCLILIVITESRGLLKSIMLLPPLRYLGRISYGLYLFHMPVSVLVFALFAGHAGPVRSGVEAWAMLWSILASLGLAALSWHLLEVWLVRYGHSLPYHSGTTTR